MFGKSLITLLTSSILASSISSAWTQDNTSSEITFACEDNNGTPITVAKNKEGQTETIFYWKEEVLKYKTPSTPQEICKNTSAELNHFIQKYNLLSFRFMGTEYNGLPTICITKNGQCGSQLLILSASASAYHKADLVLQSILNPNIINKKIDICLRQSRGCSQIMYQVALFKNE